MVFVVVVFVVFVVVVFVVVVLVVVVLVVVVLLVFIVRFRINAAVCGCLGRSWFGTPCLCLGYEPTECLSIRPVGALCYSGGVAC